MLGLSVQDGERDALRVLDFATREPFSGWSLGGWLFIFWLCLLGLFTILLLSNILREGGWLTRWREDNFSKPVKELFYKFSYAEFPADGRNKGTNGNMRRGYLRYLDLHRARFLAEHALPTHSHIIIQLNSLPGFGAANQLDLDAVVRSCTRFGLKGDTFEVEVAFVGLETEMKKILDNYLKGFQRSAETERSRLA